MSVLATLRRTLSIVVFTLVLGGCALFGGRGDDQPEDEIETNESLLYQEAQASIRAGNYTTGVERLELLDTHFPFGQYAEQAKLDLIWVHYMKSSYDASALAAERFIDLHPQHPNADYAYYMKGLVAFERNRGFFDRILGSPEALRDTTNARQAFLFFGEFLQRFPDSIYAKDARQRMIHLRNIIAEAEVHVANFYMGRGYLVAAVNRANDVVRHFPSTSSVPDALAIMYEANIGLGLSDPANDALDILRLNFPDYRGFDANGNLRLRGDVEQNDRSLVNVLTLGLLGRPQAPPQIPTNESLPESDS